MPSTSAAFARATKALYPLPSGNTVAAVGDSITVGSGIAVNLVRLDSYVGWVWLLSGGALRPSEIHATGGYTAQQVLNEHVAGILDMDPLPAFCLIHAGANDLGADDVVNDIITPMRSIIRRLKGEGVVPVVVSLLPSNGASATLRGIKQEANLHLFSLCGSEGAIFVDAYREVVDPATGDWKAGHYLDSTHPNKVGSRAIGQAVLDTIKAYAPTQNVLLASDVNEPNLLFTDPLFQTDSGGTSGVADVWDTNATGESNATITLVAASPDAIGNWQQVAKTASATTKLQTGLLAANSGDRLAWGFVAEVEPTAASDQVDFTIASFNGALLSNVRVTGITEATGLFTFYTEFSAAGSVRPILEVSGLGTVRVAQWTLRNLTALGIA